jgi:hypothetical protein
VNQTDNEHQPNAKPDGTADYEANNKIRHRATSENVFVFWRQTRYLPSCSSIPSSPARHVTRRLELLLLMATLIIGHAGGRTAAQRASGPDNSSVAL